MPEINNLTELLTLASPELLTLIASSNTLVKNRATLELKNRGRDKQGNYIGFNTKNK